MRLHKEERELRRINNKFAKSNYSKRIKCCYILEQYAIYFKIPLKSPFFKGGDLFFPLFGKEGPGEIY